MPMKACPLTLPRLPGGPLRALPLPALRAPPYRGHVFRNRHDAGVQLGERIRTLGLHDTVVLGLPRGGVPVAAEVARALGAPLDVILVRKLGSPSNPEYAMGAIGEDGVRVLHPQVLAAVRVTPEKLAAIEDAERIELERRGPRASGGGGAPGVWGGGPGGGAP